MVRIAKEDTYATEDVGGGVTVRRRIVAGQKIPDSYDVEGKTDELDEQPGGLKHYDPDMIEQRVSAADVDPELAAATEAAQNPDAESDDDDDEHPKRSTRRKGAGS